AVDVLVQGGVRGTGLLGQQVADLGEQVGLGDLVLGRRLQLGLAHLVELVHRGDDDEVHDGGDEQEVDGGRDDGAEVQEGGRVVRQDAEAEAVGGVGAADGVDERLHEVFGEGGHDGGERSA